MKKANNEYLTYTELERRTQLSIKSGYSKQKWIIFAEEVMSLGYKIRLYEARQTYSKYLTVIGWDAEFKVRFSNHKPIYAREARGDCDFFVGITHLGVRTYLDAIQAVKDFFQRIDQERGRLTHQRYSEEEIKNATILRLTQSQTRSHSEAEGLLRV